MDTRIWLDTEYNCDAAGCRYVSVGEHTDMTEDAGKLYCPHCWEQIVAEREEALASGEHRRARVDRFDNLPYDPTDNLRDATRRARRNRDRAEKEG